MNQQLDNLLKKLRINAPSAWHGPCRKAALEAYESIQRLKSSYPHFFTSEIIREIESLKDLIDKEPELPPVDLKTPLPRSRRRHSRRRRHAYQGCTCNAEAAYCRDCEKRVLLGVWYRVHL